MQKRIKILQSSLVEEKVFSVQQKLDEATTFPQERICVISKNGKIVEKAGLTILREPPKFSTTKQWVVVPDPDQLKNDDVVLVQPHHKRLWVIFRRGSNSNSLFVTSACNSNCLMCPQPPKEKDDVSYSSLLQQIQCLPDSVEEICVTGGEPTILGTKFIEILKTVKNKNPACSVHVLSNARLCKDKTFVNQMKSVGLESLTFGIPLYSSIPECHDYIVQSKGAFDETIEGIYNLAGAGIGVEIRIVLHKQTIKGLGLLADYIYNKIPYVRHVAFMAMEHMGYVKRNWDLLWVHPLDYKEQLLAAVRFLYIRGVNVSIYNLPYCLCDKRMWGFLRQSISDYKVDFNEECEKCALKGKCCGLFHYQREVMEVKRISAL